MKFVAFMRALITASLLHVASAGELGKILGSITKFDPLVPAAHETHINVGVYFEMLHKVDDVAHTFDAEFTLVYQWHDPRNYSDQSGTYDPRGEGIWCWYQQTLDGSFSAVSKPNFATKELNTR